MDTFDKIKKLEIPSNFSLKQFSKISDLIYFDRPLLSHLTNEVGDTYIYSWVDKDENRELHFLYRINPDDLELFLLKKKPLRDLLVSSVNGLIYVIETQLDTGTEKIALINSENLPTNYMPSNDSFYSEDYEKIVQTEQYVGNSKYRVLIQRDWSIRDFFQLPRLYEQIYSFLYHFKQESSGYRRDDVEHTFRSQPWKGGWSTVNFYEYLVWLVEPPLKLKITSVRYASPGWIEFRLDLDIARALSRHIKDFQKNSLKSKYNEIYKFFRKEKMTKLDGRTADEKLSNSQKQILEKYYLEFSEELLHNNQITSGVKANAPSTLLALKIMLSVYRKLRELAEFEQKGLASY